MTFRCSHTLNKVKLARLHRGLASTPQGCCCCWVWKHCSPASNVQSGSSAWEAACQPQAWSLQASPECRNGATAVAMCDAAGLEGRECPRKPAPFNVSGSCCLRGSRRTCWQMTDDGQNKPLSNQINATYLRLLSATSSLMCFTPYSLSFYTFAEKCFCSL